MQAGVQPSLLDRVLHRAHRLGVSFETALYASGTVTEQGMVSWLAQRTGLPRLEPGGTACDDPLGAAGAIARGALRLSDGRIVLVPRGPALPGLLAGRCRLRSGSQPVLATRQDLIDLAVSADGQSLAAEAADGLARRNPELSAKGGAASWQRLTLTTAGAGVLALWLWTAALAASLTMVVSVALFLALAWLRLAAFIIPPAPPDGTPQACPRLPDRSLPVYTVLVPLRSEHAALPGLIAALGRLDYPRERLDIKLLVEADDRVTLRALARVGRPDWVDLVRVPPGGPATKPRALNVGLALARGALVTVFDAEDRPERGQLRAALAAFCAGGPRLGVVQAQLVIDPRQMGWLAEQFRLEYAGLFAVLLPGLAAMNLPLPLGGTSNHFPAAVLRRLGGWDAHNVTEDMDLGLRLARAGYHAAVIPDTTLEEAPEQVSAWLRQRTRWLKGWMVSLMVHTRRPGALVADLGPWRAAGALLVAGGTVASALAEPPCLLAVLASALSGGLGRPVLSWADALLLAGAVTALVIGHGAAALTGMRGLRRLGRPVPLRAVALLPLYWLLISVAAWRALWQAVTDPSGWEKTEHRLARRPGGMLTMRAGGPGRPRSGGGVRRPVRPAIA